MCGRFTQHYTWAEVQEFLSVFGTPRNLQPHYNIAPTTTVDVVRLGKDGRRELVPMRWGSSPTGGRSRQRRRRRRSTRARNPSQTNRCSARPFRKQRCIIPASGFYEWTGEKGDKQPHVFTAADGSPVLAFAGLWDRWRHNGEDILSCMIIVRAANRWMATYHERMPVILDEGDFTGWLDGTLNLDVLKTVPESYLREWLVLKRVNRTGEGDDDPAITEPLTPIEAS